MVKYSNIILLMLSLILLAGCGNQARQTATGTDTTAAVQPDTSDRQQADSCEQYIYRLVASTNLFHTITTTGDSMHMHIDADSLNFFIDDINDSTVTVKLSHDNEAEPGAFVDAVDAWIFIDLKKQLVSDVTIDPDSPVRLVFDRSLLQKVSTCHTGGH